MDSRRDSQKPQGSRSRFARALLSLFLAVLLFCRTVPAAADAVKVAAAAAASASSSVPLLVSLKIGMPAPFDGVLLNPPAVAQIAATADTQKRSCDLRVEEETSKVRAFSDAKLADKDAELKDAKSTLGLQIADRDAQIKRLQDSQSGPSTFTSLAFVTGGVFVGFSVGAVLFGLLHR